MLSLALDTPQPTTTAGLWLEVLSWQNLLSLAALVVALVSLLHTVSGRPMPLVDIRKVHRKENGEWVVKGDVLDVFNVGRRPLPVRAVGTVTPEGSVSMPADNFEFLGDQFQNPKLPLVLQPGDRVTFAFPAGWVDEQRRLKSGYCVEWIKGRRRGQRARISRVTLKGKRLP